MNATKTTKKPTTRAARGVRRPATPRALDIEPPAPNDEASLEWQATEYVPKRRWWWYLALGYITLAATLVLYGYGNWSAAILALVTGIGIIALHTVKARPWHYRLDGSTLTLRLRNSTSELNLENYHAFTIIETVTDSETEAFVTSIVLLPKKRLGVARDIFLTGDSETDTRIARRLDEVLLFEAEPSFATVERVLTWATRALRIW